MIKGEQKNDTNLGCCHECSDPVECDYYCEWLVLKYANNPTLQNVCKMKWRDVIHAEYCLLSNFGTYKKKLSCGNVVYPYNTKERHPLPKCAHDRIEDFIEDQFREQSLKWHEAMINKLGYSDSIQKDFIKQTLDPLKRRESFSKWDGRNRKPHAIS